MLFMVLSMAMVGISAAIPSPVAYFAFDPAGDHIQDSVSGKSFALPSSALLLPGGAYGSYLSLRRTDDSFLLLGKSYGFPDDFSISFWMKTAPGYKDTGTMIMGRHLAGWTNGYWFMINAEWGYGAPDKLTFYYSNATVISKTSVNDGRWHHVGLVLKKKEGASLFIDGSLEAKGPPTPMIVPDAEFILGGIQWNPPKGSFAGGIDELSIFDKALEDADMAQIARAPNWFIAQKAEAGVPNSVAPGGTLMKITLKNGQVINLPLAEVMNIEFKD